MQVVDFFNPFKFVDCNFEHLNRRISYFVFFLRERSKANSEEPEPDFKICKKCRKIVCNVLEDLKL